MCPRAFVPEQISNEEQSEWDREDATWALRAMTDPALEQRKRNVAILISTGAVEPLIDLLSHGPNPGCKEQAITVLRNICREASPSQRKVHPTYDALPFGGTVLSFALWSPLIRKKSCCDNNVQTFPKLLSLTAMIGHQPIDLSFPACPLRGFSEMF